MFYETKTLIVVYKDEMLLNQLKKLVESNDDKQDGTVVGTKDNAIKIVSWTEKVWLNNKKAGNIDTKVLFMGDIKGTDELIPVLDIKFESFGVKYGWAGNQAALFVDEKALKDHNTYLSFLEEIGKMAIPDIVKNANKPKSHENAIAFTESASEKTDNDASLVEESSKNQLNFFNKAKGIISKSIDSIGDAVEKLSCDATIFTQDLFRNKAAVTRQMLFYGVINLYENGLDEFMRL